MHALLESHKFQKLLKNDAIIIYAAVAIFILTAIFFNQSINDHLYISLHNLLDHPSWLYQFIAFIATDFIYLLGGLFVAWIFVLKRNSLFQICMSLGLLFVTAYLLSKIGTHIIPDPRPYIIHHFSPIISIAGDNGFPSDHTLVAFSIATCVFLYDKRASIVCFALATMIGGARIIVGAHHPLDVSGSMAIVCISLILTSLVLSLFAQLWQKASAQTRSQ